MKNKITKILLIFVLMFSHFTGLITGLHVAFADTTINLVTTSVTYADRLKTDTIAQKDTVFYINVAVSGIDTTYIEPYVDVAISKSQFERPLISSTASGVKTYELIEQADKYIMRFTYNSLSGGTNISVPFQLRTKFRAFAKNEKYLIQQTFYSSDGVKVFENTNEFNVITDDSRLFLYNNNELFTVFGTQPISSVVPNDYTFEYVYESRAGNDKRDTVLTIQVPNNFIFNQSDHIGWEYDSVNKILKRNISQSARINEPFKGQLANQVYNQSVPFIYAVHYLNEDGTLEKIKEDTKYISFRYQVIANSSFGIGKRYKSNTNSIEFSDNFNNVFDWELSVAFNSSTDSIPIGERLVFNKITDIPRMDPVISEINGLVFGGINFYTTQATTGVYDAGNLAKLSRNRLVGTLPDGNTEVIATDIPLKTVNDNQFVPLNGKVYKQVDLIFNEEVAGTKIANEHTNILNIEYRTHFSESQLGYIKRSFSDIEYLSTYGFVEVLNYATISNSHGNSSSEVDAFSIDYPFTYLSLISNTYKNNDRYNSNSIFYLNDTLEYSLRFNILNVSKRKKTLRDGKYVILAPTGLDFKGIEHRGDTNDLKLSDTYEIVYNYKNTGKNAYIFDIVASDINPEKTYGGESTSFGFVDVLFTVTNAVESDTTLSIETFVSHSNKNVVSENDLNLDSVLIYKDKRDVDTLDVDEDGDTAERILYAKSEFIVPLPKELVINKLSKNDGEVDGRYNSTTIVDGESTANYRVDIFNNTDQPVNNATIIDVLPYLNDKAIVADKDGVYAERGTQFITTLKDKVTAPDKYTVYYSTDTPKSTLNENVNVNWQLENEITDFSKVTALKFVLNQGEEIAAHTRDYIYFDVNTPSSTTVEGKKVSNNSVAYYYGNNISGTVESLKNTLMMSDYVVKGKAYYDTNDNATFDATDSVISNRQVTLYEVVNGQEKEIATQQTTDDGTYNFSNSIEKNGVYRVKVAMSKGDTQSSYLASTNQAINNDLTTNGYAEVRLTSLKQTGVLNLAVKNEPSTVIVMHKDENGAQLANEETLTGTVHTTYTTTPTTVENYEVVVTPINANGTYTPDAQTVNYVYRRKDAGNITVTFKDENGVELSTPTTLDGTDKLGLNYTTTPATVENYELVETPTNANGTYTTDAQTVNYVYRRKDAGNITVTFKDENGVELSTPTTLDGTDKLGLSYTTTPATVENYEVVVTPTNANGTYTDTAQTVNYVYRRKDAGNITVTFKDENGVELSQPTTLDGTDKLGLSYTTTPATVENYEVVVTPTNANGTYTPDAQTVNYVYRRKDVGNITVTFKDENGVELSTPTTLDGTDKLGLTYTTSAVTVENYELVETPTNANGTYTTDAQTVNYVYRRKDAGNVTVTFKDENGVELSQPTTLDGTDKLGLNYTTTPATVENYEVVVTPTNTNGTYTTDAQTVNYVYRRKDAGNITVTYKDENGVELSPTVTLDGTVKLNTPYTTTAATINNYELVVTPTNANGTYTTDAQTVNYVYRRKDAGNITVTFKDENGVELSTPTTLDGTDKLGLDYTTTPATVENYEVVVTPTHANGTYTTDAQTVNYVYRRKDAGNITVTFKDENGVELSQPTTLDGIDKLGLSYTTTPAEVENYEVVVTPINANGTYTADAQTVNYVYRRKDAGNITVTFKDENGVELSQPTTLDGTDKLGLEYTTTPATVENYEVVVTPTNANGTYTTDAQTVNYVYRRKDAGNVTVTFKDENGVELSTPTTLDGTDKLGLTYTTSAVTVENYELVTTPTNANGSYTTAEQVVIYVYRKVKTEKLDQPNNQVSENTDKPKKNVPQLPKTGSEQSFGLLGLLMMVMALVVVPKKQRKE